MSFPEKYDPKEAEPRIQQQWHADKLYVFDKKGKGPVYSIDTPPPTVSGKMHMGHAFSYNHADFIARYHRMKGERIFYPFGLDDNGLATERFVEKKINKRATMMSRKEFIETCLRETKDVEAEMLSDWQRLGLSCDFSWLYRTIDDNARAISQASFIDLFKQQRAYRKEAPSIWCPECRTAIAQVELEDKELSSHFNDITFTLENNEKITIATTRPELLAACVAVIVHPEDARYAKLIGKKAIVPIFNQHVPIIADDRADPEKGSGIVMCCTFGDQKDMEWWKAYNLPLTIAINPDGKLNERAGNYAGLKIKEARKKIIEDMKHAGILTSQKEIKHVVNVHERCGIEIEFLVSLQWYIRYLDLREKFLQLGEELVWYPAHMKNRYDNWVKGLQWDWSISRQRFFGVPFPVWYCAKCDEPMVADQKDLPVDPLEDKPTRTCTCGSSEFVPEKDIMDTWATSSLTPQIALRKNEDPEFFASMFPMSLRPQAHDIISFWLFNTVVKSYFHQKQLPWKRTMISGWALDPQGKKMSKSKGNVIDPQTMLTKYNADALRYWASSTKLGEDLAFNEKEFVAGQRTITKLWNASSFVSRHLESYDKRHAVTYTLIDKWIRSELSKLVTSCTESFENYEYVRIRLDADKFFWQSFCDNYLEFVKDRLYNPDNYPKEAVEGARHTLYDVLFTIVKLFAPIVPHVTEEIYQHLFKHREHTRSIHLTHWPTLNEIDEDAEHFGAVVVELMGHVRKFKSQHKLSFKHELTKITLDVEDPIKEKITSMEAELKAIVKVKEIIFSRTEEIKGQKMNLEIVG